MRNYFFKVVSKPLLSCLVITFYISLTHSSDTNGWDICPGYLLQEAATPRGHLLGEVTKIEVNKATRNNIINSAIHTFMPKYDVKLSEHVITLAKDLHIDDHELKKHISEVRFIAVIAKSIVQKLNKNAPKVYLELNYYGEGDWHHVVSHCCISFIVDAGGSPSDVKYQCGTTPYLKKFLSFKLKHKETDKVHN